MRKAILGAVLASATLAGCVGYDESRPEYAGWTRYDYDRPDPAYGGYYADRYYRDDPRYHERRLTERDRIYAGRDGRYYCRRSDGTTGLIVGGIAGGVLGNALAPGRSEVLGTLLGAAAGAAVGASIDRDHVTCR
jgi:hypothetical protein